MLHVCIPMRWREVRKRSHEPNMSVIIVIYPPMQPGSASALNPKRSHSSTILTITSARITEDELLPTLSEAGEATSPDAGGGLTSQLAALAPLGSNQAVNERGEGQPDTTKANGANGFFGKMKSFFRKSSLVEVTHFA